MASWADLEDDVTRERNAAGLGKSPVRAALKVSSGAGHAGQHPSHAMPKASLGPSHSTGGPATSYPSGAGRGGRGGGSQQPAREPEAGATSSADASTNWRRAPKQQPAPASAPSMGRAKPHQPAGEARALYAPAPLAATSRGGGRGAGRPGRALKSPKGGAQAEEPEAGDAPPATSEEGGVKSSEQAKPLPKPARGQPSQQQQQQRKAKAAKPKEATAAMDEAAVLAAIVERQQRKEKAATAPTAGSSSVKNTFALLVEDSSEEEEEEDEEQKEAEAAAA